MKISMELPDGCEIVIKKIESHNDHEKECSFCGRMVDEKEKLVCSNRASICGECIELARKILAPGGQK